MPASYPNSVKIFTTKTTGQTILASHINEPQDEITAIEQGLLQGLQHALFPNTDAGQDLGTTTKRWRQLLVQKIASGITNATRLRVQEVGTSTWITVNADFDGTNWNREDTDQPAQAIEINSAKEVKYYRAAAGANPITWTNVFTISTDKVTASQAVIGTDPGGTEVLRAETLRATHASFTGAVVGADPGGTEALRTQSLRAGPATFVGNTEFTQEIDIQSTRTSISTFDASSFHWIRRSGNEADQILGIERVGVGDHNLHTKGQIIINPPTSRPPLMIGANSSGHLVAGLNADQVDGQHLTDLDTRFVNAAGDSMTGTLSAPTVVAGTDPGGTESLRAGSARLNAPVLLGSVPQFTMAADPTAALQVATKQYVDNVAAVNLDTLDARYVNVTGDSMSGALVVGTDPGGTALLRAQSLRAGSGRVGSWQPLGVINVTSATTSIQFSGLGLSPPILLRLLGVVVNSTASASNYHLRVNGESNSLDWAVQHATASGTTVGGARIADSSSITYVTAGFRAPFSAHIAVTGGGFVMCTSTTGRSEGTDTPVVANIFAMKNTAITSLSSIELVAEVTGAIGAGSLFFLEYLAP
jgi:hypothetical protein